MGDSLFAAAVDIDLRLPDVALVPRDRLGETLVAHFIRRWEGDPTDDALLTLLRSAATDESVAERLRGIFREQVAPVALSVAADPAEAALRAGLVATSMLGLALCRQILMLPPIVAATPDVLVTQIGATVQRYLTGPREACYRRPMRF